MTLRYGQRHVNIKLKYISRLEVCGLAFAPAVAEPVNEVKEAVRNPTGAPPLREISRGKRSAAIAVSDFSRRTLDPIILPILLEELRAGGIPESATAIVIARGLHRRMTTSEVRRKLGPDIPRRIKVIQHNPDRDLVRLGTSKLGNEIWMNRMVFEADVKIATGDIVPHPYAGFSGGGKAVMPGLAGRASILRNHLYVRQGLYLGRMDNNPVREEIDEAARMLGLDFIINTVMNSEGELVKVVAGDPIAAHRVGAQTCTEIYRTPVPYPPDILLVSSYPYDSDFYYASKSLENVVSIVPRGGCVVMLSPCRRGWGTPDLKYFLLLRTAEEILDAIEKNPRRNLVTAIVAYQIARLREKSRVVLCAKGLPPRDVRRMQMEPTVNVQKTVNQAIGELKNPPRVIAMPHAAVSMPVLALRDADPAYAS